MALVLDPRTGRLVNVPDTNYAALAQGNAGNPVVPAQPFGTVPISSRNNEVLGAAGLPAGYVAPAAAAPSLNQEVLPPAAPAAPDQPDVLGDLVSGVNKASLGAVGSLIAAPASGLRRGLVGALGGDTSQLAPLTDQTFGLANEGVDQASGALTALGQGARSGFLSLLGAQPAVPAAPTAVQTPVAPVAAGQVVAPVAAPVMAATQRPPLTAADLAPTNETVASLLSQPQRAATPATGNSFNASNTAVRSAAPTNNGVNFGFGGNGETATGYLQRMAAQDSVNQLQSQLTQRATMADLEQKSIVAHLNDPFTNHTQRRTLLAQLQIGQQNLQQANSAQDQFAAARVSGMQRSAGAQSAQQLELQKALLEVQGKLGVADLNGQYDVRKGQIGANATLGAAGITGQARVAAASGTNALALANAQRSQSIANATQAWLTETDPTKKAQLAQTVALLKEGQIAAGSPDKDPITGLTIAPQAVVAGQASQILTAQQQLQKQLASQR